MDDIHDEFVTVIKEFSKVVEDMAKGIEAIDNQLETAEQIMELDKEMNPSYYVFCPRAEGSVGPNQHVNLCLMRDCECGVMLDRLDTLHGGVKPVAKPAATTSDLTPAEQAELDAILNGD